MTTPSKLDEARLRELRDKLRAKRTTGVMFGKFWNPDGPEAADAIEALLDALSADRERASEWKGEWEGVCAERIADREKTQQIINDRDAWIGELIQERDALIALVREGMEEAIPDALIFGMHTNADTWIKAKNDMQAWCSRAVLATQKAEGAD